ncbi:hypothetical protein BDA96_04G351300 [Sorghum bicolor]|uniref:Uncharacterized protein n=1 Tax=Sorghum bicolor TaxID=4558 RepID=A0A921R7V2_SORBI|nr:hypothetical protein BDA96_04G351300 [Sorghum bicolor]
MDGRVRALLGGFSDVGARLPVRATTRRSTPRACSWHRLVVVRRMDGRVRALLGGISDTGASESNDEEEEHALRGGQQEGEVDDAVALSAAAIGLERWDVLGLGQAVVIMNINGNRFSIDI